MEGTWSCKLSGRIYAYEAMNGTIWNDDERKGVEVETVMLFSTSSGSGSRCCLFVRHLFSFPIPLHPIPCTRVVAIILHELLRIQLDCLVVL